MMENAERINKLSAIFEPKAKESSVSYVINNIKDSLLAQKILPGEKLPSEMELAKLLSVSRGSIREAMKILSAFGIIDIKRGDGTYVASEFDGNVIFDPLLFSFILSQPAFEELQQLRLMLEEYIIQLVIMNQTEQVIESLQQCNEQFKNLKCQDRKANYEEILAADLQFHHLLAKFAQNRLIEKIYMFVLDYFKPYIRRSIEKPVAFLDASVNPHEEIVEAIREKDVERAKMAVGKSIEVWKQLVVE